MEPAKNEKLLIVPIPSLVSTLLNREQAKGSPLTQSEVLGICNQCPCVAMTAEQMRHVERGRGYQDIDPEHVWEQWQVARQELAKPLKNKPSQDTT